MIRSSKIYNQSKSHYPSDILCDRSTNKEDYAKIEGTAILNI